jgi:hypothetical protein
MRRASAPSLLDDPFFLAELERVEIDPREREERLYYGAGRTGHDASEASANDDPREPLDDSDWWPSHPVFEDEIDAGRPGRLRTLLAVSGFLVMTLAGACAAAAVFHDRLAFIFR